MEITSAYAIAAGGFLLLLVAINALPHFQPLAKRASLWTSKHLTYPYLMHRHRFFGPWSRATVLIQMVYATLNVFGLSFRTSDLSGAGRRAAKLALVNLIPLFAGPNFGFLSDVMGVPLNAYQTAHRSAGSMAMLLVFVHIFGVVAEKQSFPLAHSPNLFAVVVSPPSGAPASADGVDVHDREPRVCVPYLSCLATSSVGGYTSFSYAYTNSWQPSSSTPCGDISRKGPSYPLSISTYRSASSRSRPCFKRCLCSIAMEYSVVGFLAASFSKLKTPSRSISGSRSPFASILASISISGCLP